MKTQALGWLAAAVLAAGLNASYHDGGLEWAHRIAGRVEHGSAVVLALASGNASRFLVEARLMSDQMIAQPAETPSCPWTAVVARAQAKMARAQSRFARLESMSDREQARLEANRERLEARIEAQTARIQTKMARFDPVVMKMDEIPMHCERIRINVPQPPKVHISVPTIHIDVPDADPI